jgi:hypothetical protein
MTSYIHPLSVVFVWHPADNLDVKPIVENCYTVSKARQASTSKMLSHCLCAYKLFQLVS